MVNQCGKIKEKHPEEKCLEMDDTTPIRKRRTRKK